MIYGLRWNDGPRAKMWGLMTAPMMYRFKQADSQVEAWIPSTTFQRACSFFLLPPEMGVESGRGQSRRHPQSRAPGAEPTTASVGSASGAIVGPATHRDLRRRLTRWTFYPAPYDRAAENGTLHRTSARQWDGRCRITRGKSHSRHQARA